MIPCRVMGLHRISRFEWMLDVVCGIPRLALERERDQSLLPRRCGRSRLQVVFDVVSIVGGDRRSLPAQIIQRNDDHVIVVHPVHVIRMYHLVPSMVVQASGSTEVAPSCAPEFVKSLWHRDRNSQALIADKHGSRIGTPILRHDDEESLKEEVRKRRVGEWVSGLERVTGTS
mmetsp:Transcript_92008/g.201642  ORF Transcript_92008/g.201642 Transcript_92008/m.201642 type:complete len:173 (+) Transcript_92008:720-1238(+)